MQRNGLAYCVSSRRRPFGKLTRLEDIRQNMVQGANALAKNMQYNFSRNVGETEQHLMGHLLYAGTLMHFAN